MTPDQRLSFIKKLKDEVHKLTIYKNISGINSKGIYAVWWIGKVEDLELLHRKVTLQGKKITKKERKKGFFEVDEEYHIHSIEWDWTLETSPVCLYVGKASNIMNRLKQHLEITRPSDIWYTPYKIRRQKEWQPKTPDIDENFLIKRTSGCQVRAGIEHLFKKRDSILIEEKLKQFGVSFIKEDNFKERFYLEDLAIGYYAPWFNIDAER